MLAHVCSGSAGSIVGRTLVAASISSGVPPARLMRMAFSARSEILSSNSLEVQEGKRLRSFS